jgi:preprotein translocase subunit Sec61beta
MARGGFEEDGVAVKQAGPVKEIRNFSKEREIKLKVNPGKIGKIGLFVIIILAVFFLGRFSANNFELTGLVTSDTVETPKDVAEEETPTEEAVVEEEPAEEVEPEVVEEEPKKAKDKSDEVVIDTYKNTKITVHSVEVDWKETWGKIIAMEYTIENGEEGAIEPGHFLVMVEGYKDIEKRASLPENLQKISSGESQTGKLLLDKPFNYNQIAAGNLETVMVRFILFNNDEETRKPIASFQEEFNLKH